MIGIDCPWCGDELGLEDVMTQAALRCDTCATEIDLADAERDIAAAA